MELFRKIEGDAYCFLLMLNLILDVNQIARVENAIIPAMGWVSKIMPDVRIAEMELLSKQRSAMIISSKMHIFSCRTVLIGPATAG